MATTKTIGPLHFEDLDAHRFEDLVRDLVYDFRDWQVLESVGRVGGDEGFDLRAREKVPSDESVVEVDDEEHEDIPPIAPMDGHVWMIQGKREKEIGPTKLRAIVEEGIKEGEKPYGYILAASVNFSKKAQDTFREVMLEKGITEFFLWGKGELEGMLMQPKNDRILFAFFGISLVVRQRSIATRLRATITSKNRITKALTGDVRTVHFSESILVRDTNDSAYPGKPKDKKRPSWNEYVAYEYHPQGLMVHIHEYYAYLDREKMECDFIDAVDLVMRERDRREYNEQKEKLRRKIDDFWEFLPRDNKVKLAANALLFFEDMQVIDTKGDSYYEMPHIFVDYTVSGGPFRWHFEEFRNGGEVIDLKDKLCKKIEFFPKDFPEPERGSLYDDKPFELDADSLHYFRNSHGMAPGYADTFFDIDEKYSHLNIRDSAPVKGAELAREQLYAQVTHKYATTVDEYLAKKNCPHSKKDIERQVGREVKGKERLVVLEVRQRSEWYFQSLR